MEAAKPQVLIQPCRHCKRGAAAATKVGAKEESKTNEADVAKLVKGLHELAVHLAQVAPAVHVPVPGVELNFARIGLFYSVDDVRMKSPSVLWDHPAAWDISAARDWGSSVQDSQWVRGREESHDWAGWVNPRSGLETFSRVLLLQTSQGVFGQLCVRVACCLAACP